MTGHDPFRAQSAAAPDDVDDAPLVEPETVDEPTPVVVAVPRDETVVVDPDMVGVLIVARHLFADDVAQGDVVVLQDGGAEDDVHAILARVVDVTDGVVRVQPFDPSDDGETEGDAEAITGDASAHDDVVDPAELTTEHDPTGPGPSGVEAGGDLVAHPVEGDVAPERPVDETGAQTATDDATGDPGAPGGAETTSYVDSDVPDGAREVVAWIDEGEDRDDQVARAGAARRVENARSESAQRTTVLEAIAAVLD